MLAEYQSIGLVFIGVFALAVVSMFYFMLRQV
jgi:hypothetical protein